MHHSPILFLTGRSGSGKSQILKSIFDSEYLTQTRAGGILAPGKYLKSKSKEYDLEIVPGKEKYFLSSRTRYPGWVSIGSFWFNPEAIEEGLKHLHLLEPNTYDLLLLDEIGPFELEGKLWARAVPVLLNSNLPMIFTIRPGIIDQVCKKWGMNNHTILKIEPGRFEKSSEAIRNWILENAIN